MDLCVWLRKVVTNHVLTLISDDCPLYDFDTIAQAEGAEEAAVRVTDSRQET
jgi:hypothetical protein